MRKATQTNEYIAGLGLAHAGGYFSEAHYRAMLRNMAPGCDVEASSTKQGGTITCIIRNIYRVPVCVQAATGADLKQTGYIAVGCIDCFEPARACAGYDDDLAAGMYQ